MMIYWALAKKWNDEQKKFDYRVEIGVTEEALNILGNQNGWVTGLPDYANVSDLSTIFIDILSIFLFLTMC